jgi:hypothetical protein
MQKILFLGCNDSQVPYLRELQVRGLKIIGTDFNRNPPGREFCDKFYNLSYDDHVALIEAGGNEKFTSNDYVFTASAQFAHRGAAIFAKHFGITYPEVKDIELCLDKTMYYEYFNQNGIPLPETRFVASENELREALANVEQKNRYYLKSDFSKNPNYVYDFAANEVPWSKIFWGRDRYLRSKYILQKEFLGVSLRINIYGERYNIFDFRENQKTNEYNNTLLNAGVISTLKSLIQNLGMSRWLLKFDVILNGNDYAVLDIGLDPPYRMVHYSASIGINFMEHYLNQYLLGNVTFPVNLD